MTGSTMRRTSGSGGVAPDADPSGGSGALDAVVPPAGEPAQPGVPAESGDLVFTPLRRRWFAEAARDVQLTRFALLRGLGFIYLVGFTILIAQGLPLLGE